jgi:hypothetical protein
MLNRYKFSRILEAATFLFSIRPSGTEALSTGARKKPIRRPRCRPGSCKIAS